MVHDTRPLLLICQLVFQLQKLHPLLLLLMKVSAGSTVVLSSDICRFALTSYRSRIGRELSRDPSGKGAGVERLRRMCKLEPSPPTGNQTTNTRSQRRMRKLDPNPSRTTDSVTSRNRHVTVTPNRKSNTATGSYVINFFLIIT